MQNSHIRAIKSEDIDTIHSIDLITNQHPWSKKSLQETIQKNWGYAYILQTKLVSFLIFADCMDYTEILLLATQPKFQNNNFASLLLDFLVKYNKKASITKILLEVRQSNTSAQKFYQKNGFGYLDTRKNYYCQPTEDALILEKTC